MKKTHRPSKLVVFLAVSFAALRCVALTPTEWAYQQTLPVAAAGLTSVTVPAATFDLAQPDLADLRLLDAARREVPYLLDHARAAEPARHVVPAAFTPSTGEGVTQMLLTTGTNDKLASLELATAAPYFLKAAHVEASRDGNTWRSLGPARPLFRQFGAEQLQLPLDDQPAAFLRITIDNARSRPVTFTTATLHLTPTTPAPVLAPLGTRIAQREEFAGETVLTLTLDGRHVPLAALQFTTTEPLFMRRVTVTVREMQASVPVERTIATGTIYRVALDGAPVREQLELPLDFNPPTRELLVHLHNGDSPPLALDGVEARQRVVNLLFLAPAAGSFTLLAGNAQAVAPRYDLAAFAGDLRGQRATSVTPGAPEPMPDYKPSEALATAPLPEVPLLGAPLDTRAWTHRAALTLARPGVQELELDPATLAGARGDLADLRVMHDGNQIPFLLERPALARALRINPESVPNTRRPSVSLWQLRLPQAGLPLRRLVLTSTTPLFQRQLRVYEKLAQPNGSSAERMLASVAWSRTPEPGQAETCLVELSDQLRTDTIWVETDNGDNPPIALGAAQAAYPVVRVIFKTATTEDFSLVYGQSEIAAPRYDLSLVATKLLTVSRNPVQIASAASIKKSDSLLAGLNAGYLFWGALTLVVIGLLAVIARLLPKPPAA